MMADMISRAYVLAEYDRQHKGPPGGARKIMEDAPAVDAIPVEWILNKVGDEETYTLKFRHAWGQLVGLWTNEQEAR